MGGSNSSSLVFLIAAAAMFYVLIIRPQQKRAKQQASMLNALEPGVEIVTIGGIYGTIVEAGEERLRIRVADGSEFEIARRAVGNIVPGAEDDAEDEETVDADVEPGVEVGETDSSVLAPADDSVSDTDKKLQ